MPATAARRWIIRYASCCHVACAWPVLGPVVRNSGPSVSASDLGSGEILIEVFLQRVVAGNLVLLAALLMQAHPSAPALREVILHLHADDGVHAGEGIDHNANQGAIAQPDERADVDRVQHCAGLLSVEY